ncbi:MoxR family ATPase [Vibrio gigantis]|uniref:AAA family ATPase n=1 Tax=Vibrio gigantis TaxID=296199 RepID=UPI002FC95CE6
MREQIFSLEERVNQLVIGQPDVIRNLIIAMLCKGNVLLEGLPGLAKTRAIKALSQQVDSEFQRIQFTPDLLPSDVTGTEIYLGEKSTHSSGFEFRKGPLFGNLILVDEINRAPAKAQAALLEAMEERQVTVAGKTYSLPKLFMTLATQNPVEQEGTYPLPEAQLDRFLLKICVGYLSKDDEKLMLSLLRDEQAETTSERSVTTLTSQEVFFSAWGEIAQVHVSDAIEQLIVDIIDGTRYPNQYCDKLASYVLVGASPRGSIALQHTARAHAWLAGRNFVTPDDVGAMVKPVLGHRLKLSYKALAAGVTAPDVIDELLSHIVMS